MNKNCLQEQAYRLHTVVQDQIFIDFLQSKHQKPGLKKSKVSLYTAKLSLKGDTVKTEEGAVSLEQMTQTF